MSGIRQGCRGISGGVHDLADFRGGEVRESSPEANYSPPTLSTLIDTVAGLVETPSGGVFINKAENLQNFGDASLLIA